jgi:hypothetical protein
MPKTLVVWIRKLCQSYRTTFPNQETLYGTTDGVSRPYRTCTDVSFRFRGGTISCNLGFETHLATPPSKNPFFPKPFPPGRFKPSKVYQRRPPLKPPIAKTLFHKSLPLAPMACPWARDLYKPLNMDNIQGYPNQMPTNVNKWLPKLPGNNVITTENHIYVMGRDMDNAGIDHEDVAMKLFTSSLTEEALDWFKGLPDNHITTYDAFSTLFKSKWSRKEDGGTLATQFNQIKKKENEMVKEFISRFDRLYNQIPIDYPPTTSSVRLLYMNAYEG